MLSKISPFTQTFDHSCLLPRKQIPQAFGDRRETWSHLTLATWWSVNGTEFWVCFSQSAVVVNRRCTSPVLSKASPPSGIKIQWIIQQALFPTQPLKRKWKCIVFPWQPRKLLSFPWARCAYITFKMKILFMWRRWSQGRPDGHYSGLGYHS